MTARFLLVVSCMPMAVATLGVQVCNDGDRVAHSGGKITCFKGSSLSTFTNVPVDQAACTSDPVLVPRKVGDADSARVFIQASSTAGAYASNTELAIQISSSPPTGCSRIPPQKLARGSFDATSIAFVTSPPSTSARSMGYCDTSRRQSPTTTSIGGAKSPSFAVAAFEPVTSCTTSAGFSDTFSLNITNVALSFRCPTFFTRTMTPTSTPTSRLGMHLTDPTFRPQLPDVYLSLGVVNTSRSSGTGAAAAARFGGFLHVRIRCTTADAVADGSATTEVPPDPLPPDSPGPPAVSAQFPTVGQCRWVEWCGGAPGQPTNGECLTSSASLEAVTRYCTGVGGATSTQGAGCQVVAVGAAGGGCSQCGLKLPGQYLSRFLICAPSPEQATATLYEIWKGRFAIIPRFATATAANGSGSIGAAPSTLCEGGVLLGALSNASISPQASRMNTTVTPLPTPTSLVGLSPRRTAVATSDRSAAVSLCRDEGDLLQRVTAAISFSVTPARLAALRATVKVNPFKEANVILVGGEGAIRTSDRVSVASSTRQGMINATFGAECGPGNQTCCSLFQTYARCEMAIDGDLGCSCGGAETECAAATVCAREDEATTSSSSKSTLHLLWLLCLIPGCSAVSAIGLCLLAARRRKRRAFNEGLADFSPQFEPVAYDDYEVVPAASAVGQEAYQEAIHESTEVW